MTWTQIAIIYIHKEYPVVWDNLPDRIYTLKEVASVLDRIEEILACCNNSPMHSF